ncbi:MAG: DEAD/DEAH box helicase family protein [Lachnospiraceae bacterium]|nr:DEAD/DEAH box helicase family protein [Lachnospiraceae bacterium]
MAKKKVEFVQDFAFFEQLWAFYAENRRKIRSRYNDLTRKFLAYNDRNENPDAFLRQPQFEALEMYVFIKEFMDNAHMYEIFDMWRNRKGDFSDQSYYTIHKGGQGTILDLGDDQNEMVFKQMKKYKESYPNYIYALTMGLGKTILMATCIFYEFLLARKYPKDERFCHNALVFAPDKTVLESLREIMTFDKSKVVPPEYASVLEPNIKFHFLVDSGVTLQTIDGSDFNIIISNNQKIILKRKRKQDSAADALFDQSSLLADLFEGDDEEDSPWDDASLMDNQRFKKLCRLPQLGVYVDEAHHLFGANLEKELRSGNENKTTLRNTINILAASTSIVACYNYTGTPYVNNQVLPEVVYAYGLNESISNGFLKDADPIGFENVKNEEFLKNSIKIFWERYGNKTYEGLPPKLAIFAANVKEATDVVRPCVEKILSKLDIPLSSILVNTGDATVTKDEDIRNFNNLDVPGTEGSKKQFIILVEKGREGWNCRSLLGIALFRSPNSKIFVLQATMRCLRKLTDEQLKATVFLSKENLDTLEDELRKNYHMELSDFGKTNPSEKKTYKVKVMPPQRKIRMKRVWHEYSLIEKGYTKPIKFGIEKIDMSRYESRMYEKESLRLKMATKETVLDTSEDEMRFSELSLTAEIARYLNISCLLAARILRESKDGVETILKAVNKYNEILYDVVIPAIFHTLYEVRGTQKSEDLDVVLLHEPKKAGYYEFKAKDELVISKNKNSFTPSEIAKSFHADTYCFDSKPELECFKQYISSNKVKEIYFTGMFTADQGDLSVHYYDPESRRVRKYYPDFLARMDDGTYQLIEVKGDHMIDNAVVLAKKEAAEEMSTASGMIYLMYAGSMLMHRNVLNEPDFCQSYFVQKEDGDELRIDIEKPRT